jgi:hypothetical protein
MKKVTFYLLILAATILCETVSAQLVSGDTIPYRLFNDTERPDRGIHRAIGKIELVTIKPECNTRNYYSKQTGKASIIDSVLIYCNARSILDDSGIDSSLIDCRAQLSDEDRGQLLQKLIVQHDPDRAYTYCYDPRNGILFHDTSGQFLAFLEICFHCGNQQLFIDEEITWLDDLQGLKALKKLFVQYDLPYGVLYDEHFKRK